MIELDWRVLGIIALALLGVYFGLRSLGESAMRKLVNLEYEQVLNSDENKVRGKFE